MIIPRPRTPSPEAENGEDDDFSELSKEEIERLARERHAQIKVSSNVRSISDDRG